MFKETKRIAFTTQSGFHLFELDRAHAIWYKVWFSLHHRVGKTEHRLQENIHGQCSVELYPSILLPLPLSNSTAVCSTKYLTDWKTIFESIIDVPYISPILKWQTSLTRLSVRFLREELKRDWVVMFRMENLTWVEELDKIEISKMIYLSNKALTGEAAFSQLLSGSREFVS